MHYIVGLGNPGEEYKETRHNVGWRVMNLVLQAWNLPSLIPENKYHGFTTIGGFKQHPVRILYPTTYMNKSGVAVEKFVPKKDIEDLIVVHDDVDLPFGQIRIGKGRGDGGNNGVKSIIESLNSKDFIRVRIGIAHTGLLGGNAKRPAGGRALEKFVLKPFSPKEQESLPTVLKTAQQALETIIIDGLEVAMNRFNESKK
jgi:PTH1 family peptidyl-tRNA hydrolase